MAAKKPRLGRGLGSLISNAQTITEVSEQDRSGLQEIDVDLIRRGEYQPRQVFDEDALNELAESIKVQGVVQPIVLRKVGEGFELIAGERRWRAAQLAGLQKMPAVIRELDSQSAAAIALVENIQREDLNPLEEAIAFQRLIEEFDLTHQQVADSVGRSRSAVTNLIRLLELNESVQALVNESRLSMGHARALLPLASNLQATAAQRIVEKDLSVRETEALVKQLQTLSNQIQYNQQYPDLNNAFYHLDYVLQAYCDSMSRSISSKTLTLKESLAPGYWSTWLLIAFARVIAYSPFHLRIFIGKLLGKLMASSKKMQRVAAINISSCLPELSIEQQTALRQQYFENQGIDLIETMTLWSRDCLKLFESRFEAIGLENLKQAKQQNRPIILLASHLSNPDMAGILLENIGKALQPFKLSITYRKQPNQLFNRFMTEGRLRYYDDIFSVDDTRAIIKHLRSGKILWYAPDMNVKSDNQNFVPFFGIPAASTTVISRLAKATNALVVPYFHYRCSDNRHYKIIFQPALDNFPTSDPTQDTLRIHHILESAIREHPQSYWWVLQRFKSRPAGEPPFYS